MRSADALPPSGNAQRYVLLGRAAMVRPGFTGIAGNSGTRSTIPDELLGLDDRDGRHATQSSVCCRPRLGGRVSSTITGPRRTFTVTGDPTCAGALLRQRRGRVQTTRGGWILAGLQSIRGRSRRRLITVARRVTRSPHGARRRTRIHLEAEDANNFAIVGIGTPVSFLRDGAGFVTGRSTTTNARKSSPRELTILRRPRRHP